MIVMMIVAILFLNIFLCYVALNLLAMLLGLVVFFARFDLILHGSLTHRLTGWLRPGLNSQIE